ncbi:SET domain-containing protein 4 [Schistosoma japonicum]|nr:SET domain-containing protein 4 [Schistosoma japonicum]
MDCYKSNKDSLKEFNDWLTQSPFGYSTINPGKRLLTISTNLQYGQRGLVACCEIKSNQCCYSIPLNDFRLILTPERCTFLLNKCHQCFNHFKQIKMTLNSFDILTVFIYHCKISTNCSLKHIWTPYLSVLPDIYLDPLSCILMHNENLFKVVFNDHINYFQSYDVNIKLKHLLIRLLTSWHHVKSLFINNDHHIDSLHYNGYDIPPKDYLWAWFTVNSRCVSCPFKESLTRVQELFQNLSNSYLNIEQFTVNHDIIYHINDNTLLNDEYTVALIPFFDFFNHKQNISTNLSMSADRKSLELYLDYSVSANEQVFINYGAHDNLTLYTEYGFSLPYNENTNEVIYLSYYFLIDLFSNFNNPLTLTNSNITNNQYTTYYENHSLQDYFHQILIKLNLSHSQCSMLNNDIIWSSVYLSIGNDDNNNNHNHNHSPSYYLALILYLMYTFIHNNDNNSQCHAILNNLYDISEDLIYSTIQLVLNRIYVILLKQLKYDCEKIIHLKDSSLSSSLSSMSKLYCSSLFKIILWRNPRMNTTEKHHTETEQVLFISFMSTAN